MASSSPNYEESDGHYISNHTWRVNCMRSQAWADEQRVVASKRAKRRRWMTLVFTCLLIATIVVVLVEVVG